MQVSHMQISYITVHVIAFKDGTYMIPGINIVNIS